MNRKTGSLRQRFAGLVIAASIIGGGSVFAAQPAAAANAWSTCYSPYQKAMNATSGNVSDLIWHIGFANCAAELANKNSNNFDLYRHYYDTWRVHYAQAARSGGLVAEEAWKALNKQGIKRGLKVA